MPAAATVTLEFLGGSVGELTMDVVGMPRFSVGQTELLFVDQTGGQICPLVAMMFGRYRIQRHPTTGAEFVARDNGAPVALRVLRYLRGRCASLGAPSWGAALGRYHHGTAGPLQGCVADGLARIEVARARVR